MTACEIGRDYKGQGVKASTTGNIYGIYDMSGGVWESVMGVLIDDLGYPAYAHSGFNADNMPDQKYYDSYELTTQNYDYSKGHLGDATKETVKGKGAAAGWYDDFSVILTADKSWTYRGGYAEQAKLTGLICFNSDSGVGWIRYGTRAVLAP